MSHSYTPRAIRATKSALIMLMVVSMVFSYAAPLTHVALATGGVGDSCEKIEGNDIGDTDSYTVNGATITFSDWQTKPGESGEYVGFSWSANGHVELTIKTGAGTYTTSGTSGSWDVPSGDNTAISNIVFCSDGPSRPECPIGPAADRIIVQFPDNWDLLDSGSRREFGPMTTNIPAGSYDVTLVSWDDAHPHGSNQAYEQYYVELFDGNASVATSSAIGDLPTNDTMRIELTDVALGVSSGVDGIMAKHATTQDEPTANSIHAICAVFDKIPEPEKPTITLIKNVINDDGGTADVSDFVLKVDDTIVESGVSLEVDPGTYTASEINLPGYTAGDWSGDCAQDGTVAVGEGDHAICEITNDDEEEPLVCPLQPQDGRTIVTFPDWRLRSDKDSQRDAGPIGIATLPAGVYNITLVSGDQSHPDGGTQPEEQWYLSLRDSSGEILASNNTTDLPDSQQLLAEKVNTRAYVTEDVTSLMAFHAAAKNAPTANSISPICAAFDEQPDEPTITLVKKVINDDGGSAAIGDFTLKVNNTVVESGKAHVVTPGTYTASEINLPGYDAGTWTGDCSADGTVSVDYGDDAVCEITNDDKQRPTITLVKNVVNNDGGTLGVDDFTLRVDATDVTSGVAIAVNPGTYTASEIQHPDYDASAWSGDCAADGTVSVDYGDDAVCEITNDDKPAPPDTTITLVKKVINNNGGTANVSDFTLRVDNTPVTSGVPLVVAPGTYTANEVNLPGYDAYPWSGDCAQDGSITLSVGDNAVCEITNDDIPDTTITLIKHVVNDDGGTKQVDDFILRVNAATVESGVAKQMQPGTYTANEVSSLGYAASDWSGDCAADGTVTLNYGDHKVCEITNDDIPDTTVTLIKHVINDDGGTAEADDFILKLDSMFMTTNVSKKVSPGTYTASEVNKSGYAASGWSGDCAQDGSLTLELGDNAVCEITNNDIPDEPEPATITLIKNVINDNGGTLGPNDFGLNISGTAVNSGQTLTVNPGTYVADEVENGNYAASSWSGDCAPDGTVTVTAGDSAICAITNNDRSGGGGGSPRLTIVKTVDPTFTNPDTTVTYTVTVENEGNRTAEDVVMTDVLPDPYFSYSDGTSGLEKSWDLGDMTPGESETITFDADVSADAIEGFYTNTASAEARNNSRVSDTAVVEVRTGGVQGEEFLPRLEIEKTVSPAFTTPGGSATYTIVVRNVGEAVAENVTLHDVMPEEITETVTGLSVLDWTIGDLAVGEEWSVTYEANVSETAVVGNMYRNVAEADADNADPVSAVADIEIRQGGVLGVEELPETGAFDDAVGTMAAITLSSLIGFAGAAGFTLRRKNQTAETRLQVLARKLSK